eukprot:4180831-Alexandrium_andersonii.AAC.1
MHVVVSRPPTLVAHLRRALTMRTLAGAIVKRPTRFGMAWRGVGRPAMRSGLSARRWSCPT